MPERRPDRVIKTPSILPEAIEVPKPENICKKKRKKEEKRPKTSAVRFQLQ